MLALVAAVTLGLLRQYVWASDSWTEVLTVFSVSGTLFFLLLLLPTPRKVIASMLSSPQIVNQRHHLPSGIRRAAEVLERQRLLQQQQHQQQQQQGTTGGAIGPAAGDVGAHQGNGVKKGASSVPLVPPVEDGRRVKLRDAGRVFGMINTTNTMAWPSEHMKAKAGIDDWRDWRPYEGLTGTICHYWLSHGSSPAGQQLDPLRTCYIQVDLLVVRALDAGIERFFVVALDALEPADGCKESLKLPRDGDSTHARKSGVL
ncbi:hypothetical protein DIPPA_21833 [Diplonema papillatum]|nr:hypothetical protein DIPPA_21833 [Diplonema papillatum]